MKALKKIAVGAAALGGTYLGLMNVIDNLLVRRNWSLPDSMNEAIANADMSDLAAAGNDYRAQLDQLPSTEVSIQNDRGETLKAWLYQPETGSKVFVLCAHGYRSSGRSEFSGIGQYYYKKRGWNVLLPDHTASGESEGEYVGFGYFEKKDCMKWAEYLISTFGEDITIVLHGVSMGAATVMLMSGDPDLPSCVRMIVSDCGYTSAMDEFAFKSKELKIDRLPGLLPIVNLINRRTAGYDFRDTDARMAVSNAKVPMLFIHGGADLFVPTFMVYDNYEACSSELKDVLVIDGADHAQSYITDKEAYEAKLDEFIEKVGI